MLFVDLDLFRIRQLRFRRRSNCEGLFSDLMLDGHQPICFGTGIVGTRNLSTSSFRIDDSGIVVGTKQCFQLGLTDQGPTAALFRDCGRLDGLCGRRNRRRAGNFFRGTALGTQPTTLRITQGTRRFDDRRFTSHIRLRTVVFFGVPRTADCQRRDRRHLGHWFHYFLDRSIGDRSALSHLDRRCGRGGGTERRGTYRRRLIELRLVGDARQTTQVIGHGIFHADFKVSGPAIAFKPLGEEPIRRQHHRREHRRPDQYDARHVTNSDHQSARDPGAKRPRVGIRSHATTTKVEEDAEHQRHHQQLADAHDGLLKDAGEQPDRRPGEHHQEKHDRRR